MVVIDSMRWAAHGQGRPRTCIRRAGAKPGASGRATAPYTGTRPVTPGDPAAWPSTGGSSAPASSPGPHGGTGTSSSAFRTTPSQHSGRQPRAASSAPPCRHGRRRSPRFLPTWEQLPSAA